MKTYNIARGYAGDIKIEVADNVDYNFHVAEESRRGYVSFYTFDEKDEYGARRGVAAFTDVEGVWIDGTNIKQKVHTNDMELVAAQKAEHTTEWKQL
jgi:hypothetical protein